MHIKFTITLDFIPMLQLYVLDSHNFKLNTCMQINRDLKNLSTHVYVQNFNIIFISLHDYMHSYIILNENISYFMFFQGGGEVNV